MTRAVSLIVGLAASAALTVGCSFEHKTTNLLEPSAIPTSGGGGNNNPSSTPSMVGTWTSNATALPNPSSCGNFQYDIASQSASGIVGTFTAQCGGGLAISGNATGQLNGNSISITATGSGNGPGIPNCAFNLTGNGTIEDNGTTLRIPFSGTTCLGPVSGTGVLHRPGGERPTINEPAAVAPSVNAILSDVRTTLVVANASASGGAGALDYDFEVARDEAFTNVVGAWKVHEQPSQTGLEVPVAFEWATVYFWRARAFDGGTTGPWSVTRAFQTPNPPAAPPPAGSGDPTFGCSGIADHEKLVDCIHGKLNPPRTVEGAFDLTRRVAWALRHEGAGLLIKNSGENITPWKGYMFAAGRICYPNGHIFKVVTDVPSTNGPSWQDNDYVHPSLYVPAMNPNE